MQARFNFFLLLSLTIHVVLAVVLFASKSIKFIKPLPQESVVFMHVVPMSEVNNLLTRAQPNDEKAVLEEAKMVENSSAPDEAPQTEEKMHQSKIEETKKLDTAEPVDQLLDEAPQKLSQDLVEQTPLPEKIEPKTAPKEIKEPVKPKEKPQKPKPIKPKEDTFDLKSLEKDLLKKSQDQNQEKASSGDKDKSKIKSGAKSQDNLNTSSDQYDDQAPESITAKVLMQKRIENNWSKPPIMRDYDKIKIKVKMELDMNQSVVNISGFEFFNEDIPPYLQEIIKESIIRAIKLSEPFDMLSLEYYSSWSSNVLIFSYK